LIEYCPTSGYPMDLMVGKMLETGLTLDDLMHLEKLSDPKILQLIPEYKRQYMSKNNKSDVILYMEAWVEQLEDTWIAEHNPELSLSNKKINRVSVLS